MGTKEAIWAISSVGRLRSVVAVGVGDWEVMGRGLYGALMLLIVLDVVNVVDVVDANINVNDGWFSGVEEEMRRLRPGV